MHLHRLLLIATLLLVLCGGVAARRAHAQASCVDTTGAMCLAAVGGGVDDVFQTSDGRYAPELTFATYLRGLYSTACSVARTNDPRTASAYTCLGGSGSLVSDGMGRCTPTAPDPRIPMYANSLDWLWTQTLRTRDDCSIVADGESTGYVPWRGRIYDLGGEANRVVLFPISDHGPFPCEAFEYTVWLTNDPDSIEVADPGAPDPSRWNPALMIRAYNQGWTRNPTATGAAEAGRADLGTFLRDNSGGEAIADSTVTVWALPCGITFRFASIMAGNNGNPVPACAFHSSDDELDAVAGLNEDDTAICVDADGDGHRDAACGGGDCDDSDPAVHPGAFEPCDAGRDLDCQPDVPCPTGTVCDSGSGLCVPACFEGGCGPGFECVGERCIDTACTALPTPCASGTVCRGGTCVDPCDGAVCPAGERCSSGACIDPCEGVACPTNQVCIARDPSASTLCGPSCACTELTVPLCAADRACDARMDTPTSGTCVDPGCETATCTASEVCVAGACQDRCAGVTCPLAQTCLAGDCAPDLCARVRCPLGEVCHEGACVPPCDLVTCAEGMLCLDGDCLPDPCFGVACADGQRCEGGSCVGGAADAGPSTGMDAGAPFVADGGGVTAPGDAGCACDVPAGRGSPWPLFAGLLALVALRRRR